PSRRVGGLPRSQAQFEAGQGWRAAGSRRRQRAARWSRRFAGEAVAGAARRNDPGQWIAAESGKQETGCGLGLSPPRSIIACNGSFAAVLLKPEKTVTRLFERRCVSSVCF